MSELVNLTHDTAIVSAYGLLLSSHLKAKQQLASTLTSKHNNEKDYITAYIILFFSGAVAVISSFL